MGTTSSFYLRMIYALVLLAIVTQVTNVAAQSGNSAPAQGIAAFSFGSLKTKRGMSEYSCEVDLSVTNNAGVPLFNTELYAKAFGEKGEFLADSHSIIMNLSTKSNLVAPFDFSDRTGRNSIYCDDIYRVKITATCKTARPDCAGEVAFDIPQQVTPHIADDHDYRGWVKLCFAPGTPPRGPIGNTVLMEPNVTFVEMNNGGSSFTIPAVAIFRPDPATANTRAPCSTIKVATPGASPKSGTKWFRVKDDNGTKVTVIAEAIEDFSLPVKGRISICRAGGGITGLMDGKNVKIRPGTYTGNCDNNGDHCRTGITLKGDQGVVGPAKNACTTIDAEIVETDGNPIKAGEPLLPQWAIPGFTPTIKTASEFK